RNDAIAHARDGRATASVTGRGIHARNARTPRERAHARSCRRPRLLAYGDCGHEDLPDLSAAARQVHAADERRKLAPGMKLLSGRHLHHDGARAERHGELVGLVFSVEDSVVEGAEQSEETFLA